jgi:hypothetical protein
MEFPAARKGDVVTHDLVPQSGTIITPSGGPCANKRVIIENKDAAHVGCQTPCTGKCSNGSVVHPGMPEASGNIIVTGSTSVLIHYLAAARWVLSGDTGTCGCLLGQATNESRTVFIGGPSGPTPASAVPAACGYVTKDSHSVPTPADYDRIRAGWNAQPGVAAKHTFPGDKKPSDAIVSEVEVKGRKIKVIVPTSDRIPRGKYLPAVHQVAKALATLPEGQLDTIKQVEASPNPNPDDAYWAKQYKTPGFTSAARGGDGQVTYFPSDVPDNQDSLDGTMNHEGGHTFASEYWKDPAKKKAWEDAMRSDGRSVSHYADNSIDEDFAESVLMYNVSRGTPCEIFANALYPARHAILRKALGT